MAQTNAAFPTIKYEGKDWSGLTSANNLAAMFGEKPIMVSNMLDTIYKVNLQDDLISKINEYPTLELVDDREYQWMLMGADSKNIPLEKATDLSGNAFNSASKPGQHNSRWYMFFPEQLFFQQHVIVGEKPDLYHVLVRSEGVQVGSSWRYEVELLTGNRELYIPYTELAASTRWSVDYTVQGQFKEKKGSGISFTSPFLMSNRINHIRKEYEVPGEMILKGENEPVSFNWQYTADGGQVKTIKTWINRIDFELDKAFRREKAKLLFFGKSNRDDKGRYVNIGDAGGEIKTGMGLREQISPANIFNYTSFNIETLVDFALSLSVGKLPEDQRHFVIGTGEHGLKMISRAIEQYAGAQALDYNRIEDIVKRHCGKAIVEDKWVLIGVNFDFNKTTLRPEAYPILDHASQILLSHSDVNIEIQGHTDQIGSDKYNDKLSLQRAETIKKYLIAKGVAGGRLTTVGKGKRELLFNEKDAVSRFYNRRVEFHTK